MGEPNTTGIETAGDDFAIFHYHGRGVKTELVLPEGALLTLASIFPKLLKQQLAAKLTPQMAREGIQPVIRTTVVRAKVSLDLHGTEVLVHFEDDLGNWSAYGIGPELAKQIGEYLVGSANEAKSLGANKPQQ